MGSKYSKNSTMEVQRLGGFFSGWENEKSAQIYSAMKDYLSNWKLAEKNWEKFGFWIHYNLGNS